MNTFVKKVTDSFYREGSICPFNTWNLNVNYLRIIVVSYIDKEAEYISRQLTLSKTSEEVITDERVSKQISIAPFLLIMIFFFVAYVLKSYASAMVVLSYAFLVSFRKVFYKYVFMPEGKK